MAALSSPSLLALLAPFALSAAAPLALAGCADAFGTSDPHAPGTSIGTFSVVGTRTSDTCGAGDLAGPATWDFSISLATSGSTLYWNNGSATAGTLAADGTSFSFDVTTIENMRDPTDMKSPACSIARHDTGAGKLNAATGATAFTGVLSYAFAPTSGSSCGDLLMGMSPSFSALPCGFAYDVSATKAATP